MRIAVGGCQHETNTFAMHPATLADFVAPEAWPGLVRGAALFDADVEECGPCVFGYGTDAEALNATVARLATLIAERESQFALQAHSIESALREIALWPCPSGRPIVLADTQDNPGGGESSLPGRFEVVALGDGKLVATGPFYRGSRMNLGPMVLLRLGELHIAVSSRKQ